MKLARSPRNQFMNLCGSTFTFGHFDNTTTRWAIRECVASNTRTKFLTYQYGHNSKCLNSCFSRPFKAPQHLSNRWQCRLSYRAYIDIQFMYNTLHDGSKTTIGKTVRKPTVHVVGNGIDIDISIILSLKIPSFHPLSNSIACVFATSYGASGGIGTINGNSRYCNMYFMAQKYRYTLPNE